MKYYNVTITNAPVPIAGVVKNYFINRQGCSYDVAKDTYTGVLDKEQIDDLFYEISDTLASVCLQPDNITPDKPFVFTIAAVA